MHIILQLHADYYVNICSIFACFAFCLKGPVSVVPGTTSTGIT
jgi:hypothetical protein